MKIIFFGTSEFAIHALEALVKSRHKICAVFTLPEKARDRGMQVIAQPVEDYAKKYALRIFKTDDVNSKTAEDLLKRQNADCFVVAAFGQILSKEVLSIPQACSINIHPSVLPKYKGAAPVQWAIINGDKETGVTIIRMNESLDRGDIILQEKTAINDDENALLLSERLSALGAGLVIKALDLIESGSAVFTPQPKIKAPYAPKLKKEDGAIDWKKSAASIKNLIRGCQPWPSAYTHLDGKLLKMLDAEALPAIAQARPARIAETSQDGILVSCGEGLLLIKRLQLEGKRELSAAEFLRGKPLKEGTVFGN